MAELECGETGAQSAVPVPPPPPPPPPMIPPHESHAASIANIIDTLQTITDTSEQKMVDSVVYIGVKLSAMEALKKGLNSVRDAMSKGEKTILEEILATTRETQQTLANKREEPKLTWSQVAAQYKGPAGSSIMQHRPQSTETKRNKEVTVTVTDEQEKEKCTKIDTVTLLNTVKCAEPQHITKEIIALRKLQSGDLLVTALTEENRISLEKNTEWLRSIASTATVRRSTFPVFIHGVRVEGINANDQKTTIAKLYEANQRLHPELEIVRVAWRKHTIDTKQRYGSFILETASAATANRIIEQGLVVDGEIKTCERFIKDATITQCFRCYQYGHVAAVCRNKTICGQCAGPHDTNSCKNENLGSRCCTVCKENHTAWSATCRIRQNELARAKQNRSNAPKHYQQETYSNVLYNNNPQGLVTDSQGWEMVPIKHKGRPSGLTRAATSSNQLHFQAIIPRGANKRARGITPTQHDLTREEPQATEKARENEESENHETILQENIDTNNCNQS